MAHKDDSANKGPSIKHGTVSILGLLQNACNKTKRTWRMWRAGRHSKMERRAERTANVKWIKILYSLKPLIEVLTVWLDWETMLNHNRQGSWCLNMSIQTLTHTHTHKYSCEFKKKTCSLALKYWYSMCFIQVATWLQAFRSPSRWLVHDTCSASLMPDSSLSLSLSLSLCHECFDHFPFFSVKTHIKYSRCCAPVLGRAQQIQLTKSLKSTHKRTFYALYK